MESAPVLIARVLAAKQGKCVYVCDVSVFVVCMCVMSACLCVYVFQNLQQLIPQVVVRHARPLSVPSTKF